MTEADTQNMSGTQSSNALVTVLRSRQQQKQQKHIEVFSTGGNDRDKRTTHIMQEKYQGPEAREHHAPAA
ncbi:hypothetical protein ON010_g2159 [Phytophthora cinnamomi]|nr:hypothetical protein ON010_g2159 [Phytophthora cinnamomi]